MNTMVGMQASLHTSISEDISSRMNNDIMMDQVDDSFMQGDTLLEDDFDPDELLKSPLFNDSGNRNSLSATSLTMQEDDDNNNNHHNNNHFDPMMEDVDMDMGTTASTKPAPSAFHSHSSSIPPLKPIQTVHPNQDDDTFVRSVLQAPSNSNTNNSNTNNSDPQQQQLFQSSFGFAGRAAPSRAGRRVPDRSASTSILPSRTSTLNPLQQMQQVAQQQTILPQQQQQQPEFAAAFGNNNNNHQRRIPSRSQSQSAVLSSGNSLNQLQQMQRFQQQQDTSGMLALPPLQPRSSQLPPMQPQSSNNSNDDPLLGGNASFQGASAAFSQQQQQQQQQQQSGGPGTPPINLNEAMEKLCGSMKRSAMSRSMVKQFSGKSLSRQGSGIAPQAPQLPNRGVYRHDSQQSLGQANNNNNNGGNGMFN